MRGARRARLAPANGRAPPAPLPHALPSDKHTFLAPNMSFLCNFRARASPRTLVDCTTSTVHHLSHTELP
ncbi:unnamed protein product, partial [Brenthis ino]